MQGHKRALTESDQKALKKSVEAPADHFIHIAAIEGAYDAFILPSAKRLAANILRAKSRRFRKNNSSGFSPARPSMRCIACCGQCSNTRWSGASSSKAPFRWTAPRNRFRSALSGTRTRCGPHLPAWKTRSCIWLSI